MKSKFGVGIKMIGLPFVGQYEKLVSELAARSAAYDLLVFPPYFLGDFVALGFLKELEPYFSLLDPQIGDDYIPVYKEPVIKRNGKTLRADVRWRHAPGRPTARISYLWRSSRDARPASATWPSFTNPACLLG
jgi:hypothetical protein